MNIKIGTIISTHGLKGHVKIFAEIGQFEKLLLANKIFTKNGDIFMSTSCKSTNKNDVYIVGIKDCNKIEDVESVIKTELFSKKEDLLEKDKILVSDLVGLDLLNNDKVKIGVVHKIVNYGRGPMLEIINDIDNTKIHQLYPATFDFIDEINLQKKYLILKKYEVSILVE